MLVSIGVAAIVEGVRILGVEAGSPRRVGDGAVVKVLVLVEQAAIGVEGDSILEVGRNRLVVSAMARS